MKYFAKILFVSLFLVVDVVLIVYIVSRRSYQENKYFITSSDAATPAASPTLMPTKTTVEQVSPDGKKKIVMTTTRVASESAEYVFTTSNENGDDLKEIYRERTNEQFIIPFNAWSPDNTYVFIERGSKGALVFDGKGNSIGTKQFIDAKEVFTHANRTDAYEVVTGWASPTLLIVNTLTSDGTQGHSYWLEIPSTAVIQLSGRF